MRDRLFMWLAPALWMFAINWPARARRALDETRQHLYLIRLGGFALILIAIVEKIANARAISAPDPPPGD